MKIFTEMMNKYYSFFSNFNVLGLAIGLMIGSNLKDVAGDFIDDILMPFVNPAINLLTKGKGEGKDNDNDKSKGVIFNVPGTNIEINLERVIASSIKFMALSVIIFVMLQFGVKIKKPVQWVEVKNFKDLNKSKTNNAIKFRGIGRKY
jgi:large-conductance mechanosensitive channel